MKLFVLYDSRAKDGDTDNSLVYITADSEYEANTEGKDPSWQDGLWYEYDCIDGKLINPCPRWDLEPNDESANNKVSTT